MSDSQEINSSASKNTQGHDRGHVPVVIVGAGPVGLALALGLSLHGVRSLLLEQKATTSRTSKAPAVHVRTREILRQWQVEPRFVAAGQLLETLSMHDATGDDVLLSLRFADLEEEADRPGLLVLEQNELEKLLLQTVREAGLSNVHFESEVVALDHTVDDASVTYRQNTVTRTVRADFVVGCDGAGSFVRQSVGLGFEGHTYALRPMLADVQFSDARDSLPHPRVDTGTGGLRFAVRLRRGLWRIVHLPHGEPKTEDVPDEEVQAHVDDLIGGGKVDVVWANRFRIHVRSAPSFRVGRVLLAGDAAHVHSPASGQGMNGGIQDAHNLAWKLAAALRGGNVDRLLDSYDVERRAVVVETTSDYTDRITRIFIQSPSFVRRGAWAAMNLATKIGPLRRSLLRRTSMIDLTYPVSPLLQQGWRARGVRLPNVLLSTPDGHEERLYNLLPVGAVLLDVADARPFADDLPLADVIRIGQGACTEPAGLLRRLLGQRDGWILIRPDATIAWAVHKRASMEENIRLAGV